jgi:hypothetical protein
MPGPPNFVTKETPSRPPALDVRQLREMWCELYKTAAAPQLSRELLMRAVAYRIQELASGGSGPELHASCTRSPQSCSKPDGSQYARALG